MGRLEMFGVLNDAFVKYEAVLYGTNGTADQS